MDYTDTFGFQWNIHRKTQLDSHTGIGYARRRLFSGTGWPERMEGQLILEAGSGAGLFTEILCTTGAEVWSFDDSSAVEANRANNGHNANLKLFRANIYDIDFPGRFDKVFCFGVLQHTPDPKAAFMSLARQVKPGGELAVDFYAFRLTGLLHWKYILRPITKRMRKETLYSVVSAVVPKLMPLATFLHRVAGRAGTRLLPISDCFVFGLRSKEDLEAWTILNTFDALSPTYDKPQSIRKVTEWFKEAGFSCRVRRGYNGIVGVGRKH